MKITNQLNEFSYEMKNNIENMVKKVLWQGEEFLNETPFNQGDDLKIVGFDLDRIYLEVNGYDTTIRTWNYEEVIGGFQPITYTVFYYEAGESGGNRLWDGRICLKLNGEKQTFYGTSYELINESEALVDLNKLGKVYITMDFENTCENPGDCPHNQGYYKEVAWIPNGSRTAKYFVYGDWSAKTLEEAVLDVERVFENGWLIDNIYGISQNAVENWKKVPKYMTEIYELLTN